MTSSVPDAPEGLDYATLRRDIARAVARLCPAWLGDLRDDLVQTAMMRIMRIADQPAGEGTRPLSASYLYRIAHSVLVDELRRRKRRQETDLDETAAATPAVAATSDPEREASSREIARGIRGCLQAMARDRRLAVTLHLQGHSVGDAARILDWAQKRTENLVYRGLADLRACLAAKGLRP